MKGRIFGHGTFEGKEGRKHNPALDTVLFTRLLTYNFLKNQEAY